jgi:hypothetical protein
LQYPAGSMEASVSNSKIRRYSSAGSFRARADFDGLLIRELMMWIPLSYCPLICEIR